MSIYKENGFSSRRAYLQSLADDNGVSLASVQALANTLGASEDFDGLVSAVHDIDAEESEATK
jgi:hypothetical protein